MATEAENLDTAIANVTARLVEVTASAKPNYSVDGESYSWAEYLTVLNAQLFELKKARQRADAPFEVRSRMR